MQTVGEIIVNSAIALFLYLAYIFKKYYKRKE